MLKFFRKGKDLSQQALSEITGINIRQIQRFESGTSDIGNITLKNAIAIADALEIDVRDLLKQEG